MSTIRRILRGMVAACGVAIVAACASDTGTAPEAGTPSFAGGGGGSSSCLTAVRAPIGRSVDTVNANTTGHGVSWFVYNNTGSTVTISSQTPQKSGQVTAVYANTWYPIPGTMPSPYNVDADVTFDVGSAGTGTVGLWLNTSCGLVKLPTWSVLVQ